MVDFYQQFEKRVDRTHLVVVVGAVGLVLALHSVKGAVSVGFGGAISYVNFLWLRRAVDYIVRNEGDVDVGRWVKWQYIGRYVLIGLGLYVTIRFTVLDLALLLAGIFSYVLAVLIECFFEVGRSLFRVDHNGRT